MPQLVKVAHVDELPPGKGKTVNLRGRDVTVYNREGRYVATSTWSPRAAAPVSETTCAADLAGHKFDTGLGESPDRLMSDELHYHVVVDDAGIFVVLEEGNVHPGAEPRSGRPGRPGGPRRRRRVVRPSGR
jgi:hypothetical protein